MARGEPPGRTYTAKSRRERPSFTTRKPEKDRTYSSSSTPTFGPGGGGAAQARLQQDLDKILPAKSKRDTWSRAAEQLYGWLGEQETLDAVERGDISPGLGAAIISAGAIPLPGAKGVGKAVGAVAKGGKKVAEKSGLKQTVGEAVGESGQRAANEAVGRKTPKAATGSKEVRAPKGKPSPNPPRREDYAHASSHSRAVSNWQKKVDLWNKSNPEDQVAQATPDRLTPGQGKAATDTERQVKKAEAEKSPEEKAVVARGERDASKARRDEQREAAQQDTSDLVGVDRDSLTGFVGRRRKERAQPTSVTMAGMEGQGAGKSVKFTDSKKGAKNERRVDDLLATMRKQLAARERAEGGTEAIRLDESGMLTPYSDPGRFTRPTLLEQQRAETQAARFEDATGRKFPSTEKQRKREATRVDPGFAEPAAGSVEDRLQREAMAEGRARDTDDRTRMLMDDGRLMGETRSQERAPGYPKGPYYDPSDKMDRAYDTYSQPQPDRATTAAQAEQNVRIGRAEGTVVPGRVTTPQPDFSGMPRGMPVMGRGGRDSQPMRSFEPMTEDDLAAQGLFPVERVQLDDNGNPQVFIEYLRVDPDVYIGGPGTPPSLKMSRPNYQGFGQGGPATTRVVPEKVATPQAPDGGDPRLFVTKEEVEARTATPGAEGPKKGEKPKQQPQSGDNSPEARRARMYEGYRDLERQGILQPGDADRIMSGGKGAKKVFEETPTGEQRSRGVKPGRATRKDDERKAREAAIAAGDPVPSQGNRRLRNLGLGGGLALGTTGVIAGAGYLMDPQTNDRPVIIPGEAYDSKNAFRPASRTPTSGTQNRPKQGFLRDKYGRRITREEFERRKAFRAKRERLKGQVPGEILRQMTAKEMKRRKRFRGNFGDRSAYNVATRNIGAGGTQTRILDTDARKRLSGAFRG